MSGTPASSSSSSSSSSSNSPSYADLLKQVRSHEVALAELDNLPAVRNVYQRNGNIFFRTTIQKATTFEQMEVNKAKSKLQKLDSS